jgi:hypothetical protein
VYTNKGVQVKPATTATAAAEDEKFIISKVSKDFNTVAMYGATVERAADGSLIVSTNGTVKVKPAPANDTSVSALMVGQLVAGQGVYIGQYAPKDRDGNSLGKIFNVFAAPQDLGGTEKYVDAVKHVAQLKNWNGFDGTNYATDRELYKAIKDGSYNGGWIIPTRDLLSGKDVDGNKTQSGNLLAAKDAGALKDTFKTSSGSGSDCPVWYLSSTEFRDYPSYVHIVRLSDGYAGWCRKDDFRLSCRPVRLVTAWLRQER